MNYKDLYTLICEKYTVTQGKARSKQPLKKGEHLGIAKYDDVLTQLGKTVQTSDDPNLIAQKGNDRIIFVAKKDIPRDTPLTVHISEHPLAPKIGEDNMKTRRMKIPMMTIRSKSNLRLDESTDPEWYRYFVMNVVGGDNVHIADNYAKQYKASLEDLPAMSKKYETVMRLANGYHKATGKRPSKEWLLNKANKIKEMK